jgi:hypothetical protein
MSDQLYYHAEEQEQRAKAKLRFAEALDEQAAAYAAWEARADSVFPKMWLTPNEFWYLATPYTKYPAGMREAYTAAVRIAASFSVMNLNVFSPIVHFHPQSVVARLPGDVSYWWNRNLPYMKSCCGMVVMEMDGWKESAGITAEIAWFEQQQKPVLYLPTPPMRA